MHSILIISHYLFLNKVQNKKIIHCKSIQNTKADIVTLIYKVDNPLLLNTAHIKVVNI